MKPNSAPDPAVRELLADWKIDAPLPPRFHEQVWRRIAHQEEQVRNPWPGARDWIATLLGRRPLAVSYVALLLFAGITAGYWHAHIQSERGIETLSANYVQMLDPYRMPRH